MKGLILEFIKGLSRYDSTNSENTKKNNKDSFNIDKYLKDFSKDIIEIKVGQNLIPFITELVKTDFFESLRNQVYQNTGVVFPEVRICDDWFLEANNMSISILEKEIAKFPIYPDKVLVFKSNIDDDCSIDGISVKEPIYGEQCVFVELEDSKKLENDAICIEIETYLMTILQNLLCENASTLFSLEYFDKLHKRFTNDSTKREYLEFVRKPDIYRIFVEILKLGYSIKQCDYIFERIIVTTNPNEIVSNLTNIKK